MAEAQQVSVEVEGRRLALSNLDKVLYPATETTKGEVLHYYARVAPVLLPILAGRPVTRVRWPHGVGDTSFFEKNVPQGAPSWLPRMTVASSGSRGGGDRVTYPFVEDLAALTYLANLAAIELHVPQWRWVEDAAANPDRLVIDLDPGSPAGLAECADLALQVREELVDAGMERAVPVTSGSKGMQVYAALDGSRTSEEIRDWAKDLAQSLTRSNPDLVVWKMTKSIRGGKVLLDWSQNTAAKTTIAPYSLRGRERPMVAAPRSWEEVQEPGRLTQLDFEEVLDRLDSDGDLFGAALGD
ncbi:non-homologous end-joining DNA ligase [Allobranchiibius sp. GilTou38]|uniref:non-homologous end-joining DNA ligase n=1 Tax=Allobranchiibius sp. GilTou38 TaxID=2815210 RepID=UPI001AA0CE56|nr:non-homologous end-joining DNA ligase [Allobranchiibius sp. GilTou38]MBO1766067.1 non-homologous end-joining DNA ligase [Allobranchiibius sp. GilTou38]